MIRSGILDPLGEAERGLRYPPFKVLSLSHSHDFFLMVVGGTAVQDNTVFETRSGASEDPEESRVTSCARSDVHGGL